MTYEAFCGGVFETNCYLVFSPEGWIFFDSPHGACDWVPSRGVDLKVVFLIPGHIGRWDLPGGDVDLLFNGIRQKLFPLGDNVTVLPGHGPPTKIGTERQTNPFVS